MDMFCRREPHRAGYDACIGCVCDKTAEGGGNSKALSEKDMYYIERN
jgi:hypothetical protein